MLDTLKRGDSILTQGGFYGVVSSLKGSVLEVKLSDDIKVKVDKGAVTKVFREDNDPTKT